MDLALRRRFFAEEIEAIANLKTNALVEALASVAREHFLRSGPWRVRSDADMAGGPRLTTDADPRRVYHNLAIAIDPERQLFNGVPGLLASWIDALMLAPGARVLHVGAGLGYYSALMGHVVGESGRIVAVEVDAELAKEARANLRTMPWVEVVNGDATGALDGRFDAVLVNAGVTHPQAAWLDAVGDGGRIVLPFTAAMPAMGATIGKGVSVLLSKRPDANFDARLLALVAIYSAIGLRNDVMNDCLGKAFRRAPFPRLKQLRRDPHEPVEECWLHGPDFCVSMDVSTGLAGRSVLI